MKLTRLDVSTSALRSLLLRSPHLNTNDYPEETEAILKSKDKYGDGGCVSLFAKEFNVNICILLHTEETVSYHHFKVVESQYYLHLHLMSTHYTPLLRFESVDYSTTHDAQDDDHRSDPHEGLEGTSDTPDILQEKDHRDGQQEGRGGLSETEMDDDARRDNDSSQPVDEQMDVQQHEAEEESNQSNDERARRTQEDQEDMEGDSDIMRADEVDNLGLDDDSNRPLDEEINMQLGDSSEEDDQHSGEGTGQVQDN